MIFVANVHIFECCKCSKLSLKFYSCTNYASEADTQNRNVPGGDWKIGGTHQREIHWEWIFRMKFIKRGLSGGIFHTPFKNYYQESKAVAGRCSLKKVFPKILQNSQENTCVLFKKETPTQVFSCEFCEVFNNAII